MASNSVKHLQLITQDISATKDGGERMIDWTLKIFVHNLIRENATHQFGTYSLDTDDLDPIDKRLFLSRLVTANDFEWMCENPYRLNEAIKDYEDEMQYFINQNLNEVYQEDMEEMNCHFVRASNGDAYWEKR